MAVCDNHYYGAFSAFLDPSQAMRCSLAGSGLRERKQGSNLGSAKFGQLQASSCESCIFSSLLLFAGRLRRLGTGRGAFSLDGNEINLENQDTVWRNPGALATLTIGEFRRDEDLPFGAHFHELEGLGPALDDLVDLEFLGIRVRWYEL